MILAKHKRENLKGIFRHNERRNKNYSNKNIDKELSYLNYSIKECKHTYEKEFDLIKEKYNFKIINAQGLPGKVAPKTAAQIIEKTLNLKDVKIYDTKTDIDGNKIREFNGKETAIAQAKQEQIKQAFTDWIFKDQDDEGTPGDSS